MSDIERLKVRAEALEDAIRELEAWDFGCPCCDEPLMPDYCQVLRTRIGLIQSEIRDKERAAARQLQPA